MNRKQILPGLAAVCLSLLCGTGCEKKAGAPDGGGTRAKTLKFSAIPDQDKKNLEKFNAILESLPEHRGVRRAGNSTMRCTAEGCEVNSMSEYLPALREDGAFLDVKYSPSASR